MDLVIYAIIMFAFGAWRMVVTDGNREDVSYINEEGELVVSDENRPIGTNYELLYEVDAYTFILKELGLM